VGLKNMTDDERAYLLERGRIADLELADWETGGLAVHERLSLQKKVLFLRAFASRGIVGEGCQAAGVSRTAIQYWRELEWFETLYQAAVEESCDRIEAEAIRRAVDGYDEPVIYQGMPSFTVDADSGEQRMLTVRKYSDALMQTILKGARPEKYRENMKIDVEGGAVGVLVVPGPIDAKTWAEQARIQQDKYAGSTQGEPAAE
jgi:hypothetical protein